MKNKEIKVKQITSIRGYGKQEFTRPFLMLKLTVLQKRELLSKKKLEIIDTYENRPRKINYELIEEFVSKNPVSEQLEMF